MRQSALFTKTTKTTPQGEVSKNASLLIKAGFINKEAAGAYALLPLGIRVFEKIKKIIAEEMDKIGGQQIVMTTLQSPEVWKKSGRWSEKAIDIWFKTKDEEYGLANTHEEPITNLMLSHIHSYKDLPVYVYQFQNKFRNEPRARGGLLRAREFVMKDLYSFSANEEDLNKFYNKAMGAYKNIFKKVGLGNITYLTFASGGAFSKYSHEFQTLCETGEDTIYLNKKKGIAVNKEVFEAPVLKELGLEKEDMEEKRAIEVGNIFKLGTRFSDALGLTYNDTSGKKRQVYMGSYGIGLGRLMATCVEVFSDDRGIVWPEAVSPFKVHLVELKKNEGKKLYEGLLKAGVDVLYDDRDASAGEKLKDADLIGIPIRLVVSEKTKGKVELKKRTAQTSSLITQNEAIRKLI